jgi:hypothetical protein
VIPAFPKPGQIKKPLEAFKTFPDGREVCNDNKAGKDEYKRRRRVMWERQGKTCGLQIAPQCMKRLPWEYATFEHQDGRGYAGSKRDDRVEIDGKPYNLVACPWCQSMKGSRSLNAVLGIVP